MRAVVLNSYSGFLRDATVLLCTYFFFFMLVSHAHTNHRLLTHKSFVYFTRAHKPAKQRAIYYKKKILYVQTAAVAVAVAAGR